MQSDTKRIVIFLGEGVFGASHYKTMAESLAMKLSSVKQRETNPKEEPKRVATVEIIEQQQEIWEKAKRHEVNTVICLSVADYQMAQRLRSEFPDLNVFVLAGKEVDGQPYIIPKIMLNHNAIEEIARF